MSELCVANSCQPKKSWFACLFMSDLAHLFAFFHSHSGQYFYCFMLFSAFILSFLSHLFITILLLAFLTVCLTKTQEPHVGFLNASYNYILDKLKSKKNNESEQDFSQLEAYKLLFETCMHEVDILEVKAEEKIVHAIESTVEEYTNASGNSSFDDNQVVKTNLLNEWCKEENDKFDDDVFCDMKVKSVSEENGIWSMSKESKEVDKDKVLHSKVVEKRIQKLGTYFDCYDDFVAHEPNSVKGNSIRLETKLSVDETNGTLDQNLGSYGSMRREKEWTKTLACKLFEERHNVNLDISEGMDLLWETYESESVNVKEANGTDEKKVGETNGEFNEDHVEDDVDVQLCCLQALNFSAGKVNLGMKSPSLRKIAKAFKGIGWLHRVSRHGKKVHHST